MTKRAKTSKKNYKTSGILTTPNFSFYTKSMLPNTINNKLIPIRKFIAENEKHVIAVTIAVLAVFLIFDFIFIYYLLINKPNPILNNLNFFNNSSNNSNAPLNLTPTPIPSPTPTPTPVPLLQGPQTYSVSNRENPSIYELDFNTIDPHTSTQIATVKVKDNTNVTGVSAKVQSENKTANYNLSLKSGTANDGSWVGSWTINDSYNKHFMITFSSVDSQGNKSSIDFSIR